MPAEAKKADANTQNSPKMQHKARSRRVRKEQFNKDLEFTLKHSRPPGSERIDLQLIVRGQCYARSIRLIS